MAKSRSNKRISRSTRLRKYEATYEACIKKALDSCKSKSRTKSRSKSKSRSRKRPLNSYQQFVRTESQKSKYKGMTAKVRMKEISEVWKQRSKSPTSKPRRRSSTKKSRAR